MEELISCDYSGFSVVLGSTCELSAFVQTAFNFKKNATTPSQYLLSGDIFGDVVMSIINLYKVRRQSPHCKKTEVLLGHRI